MTPFGIVAAVGMDMNWRGLKLIEYWYQGIDQKDAIRPDFYIGNYDELYFTAKEPQEVVGTTRNRNSDSSSIKTDLIKNPVGSC